MNDAPLDYKELWYKLRALLAQQAKQEAERAATAMEEFKIRRAQGAYDMARRVIALMDDIKSRESGAEAAFSDDEESLKH